MDYEIRFLSLWAQVGICGSLDPTSDETRLGPYGVRVSQVCSGYLPGSAYRGQLGEGSECPLGPIEGPYSSPL